MLVVFIVVEPRRRRCGSLCYEKRSTR